tara:strand:- start:67 stop:753 length:687 start_codon:yes stop_codon:yes gene_type:complete
MKAMPHLEDDPVSQTRLNMVEGQLKPGGVRDYALTKMIGTISREAFVGSDVRAVAYADRELPSQAGDARRVLLSPLAFARLAELAELRADDVVLDIAGGSGYSAAVIAGLVNTVIALEDDEAFCEKAGTIWQEIGVDNAVAVQGRLAEGQAKQAPFNVIFINGCVVDVPRDLLGQLVDAGRLVCVQEVDGAQKAIIYTRIDDSFARRIAFDVCAPELESFKPAPKFKF